MRAWSRGETVELRNPASTRPWQHVLEPLSGYLCQAAELYNQDTLHGESFNFGPDAKVMESVEKLVEEMALHWDKVSWKDVSGHESGPYESGLLKLNCDKALHFLKWHAVLDFKETIKLTSDWYREHFNDESRDLELTRAQIDFYMTQANKLGLAWTL